MSILTRTAYAGTIPSGSRIVKWTADLNGISQAGVLCDPSAAVTCPGGVYVRGGTTGPNVSLTDSHVEALGDMTLWDDSAAPKNGPPGYALIAPNMRGAGASFTGAGTGAGVDEFGGDDVDDVIQALSCLTENGALPGAGQPKVRADQLFTLAASGGAMRTLAALRRGMRVHACALRAPFLNVLDWDGVDATNQGRIGAMIPGFSAGPVPSSIADLTSTDIASLEARSPLAWDPRELPYIPYLVVIGDQDDTAKITWAYAWAERMQAAGHIVYLRPIAGGDHQWTDPDANSLANLTIRSFLASVFRTA
jgi:pimeloyl-ACP methyl ester carboxylesterase